MAEARGGQETGDYDNRLIGAASALNRLQVWFGDILIETAHWRAAFLNKEREPRSGHAPLAKRRA